ncbi:HD domain-containing protein [Pirellulales bacterium]|nr:HD domain-containing protein [Pirellulales bacterium]
MIPLSELAHGQEADFFAVLSAKEEMTTKDGKPYYRVSFRDAGREVSFPVWNDVPLADACRDEWEVGSFYKLRAAYREHKTYGPQLEIRKIRPTVEDDRADGFDPGQLIPRSRVEPEVLFDQLFALVETHIAEGPLRNLVLEILGNHRTELLRLPAATHNHHAYAGGFLEHVLSVSQTCVHFGEKYAELFPDLQPPLDPELIVAGGVLHDIGKLRELETTALGAAYTPAGTLIGHMLQGRDILLEAKAAAEMPPDRLLRLEHIIVSHQRLPEWGAPKPPMTLEAMLVHYADDSDAKVQMMATAIGTHAAEGFTTSVKNPLGHRIYVGTPDVAESIQPM